MRKKSETVSWRAKQETIEERRASEHGRRLPFTIKGVTKRLVRPTEEDRGKVERKAAKSV
jgi:hypothetical protein